MRIVVAVDGSPIAFHALRSVLDLVTSFSQIPELHVVSVADHVSLPGGLTRSPGGAPDLIASEAETALAVAREIAGSRGIPVETMVLRGHAAAEILAYATRIGANLLAAGTRGRSVLERAVVGSTSEALIRKATMPVLTVNGSR